jgi:hypothetical protein
MIHPQKDSEGVCKLCGRSSRLVKSHIIPRAFFEIGDDPRAKLVSNVEGQFPRKAPSGVWARIVCDSCERSFGEYDDYAATVLLNNLDKYKPEFVRGQPAAIVIPDIDYRRLKLFVVAVLWRAAVSSHDFYVRVKIGPFERRAREMLQTGDPGEASEFATWWSVFNMSWSPGIMDPFRERWSGINAYRFYLGRVLAYVKVDIQKVPSDFRDVMMAPGRDLVLIVRDYKTSKDFKAMGALLRTAVRSPGKPIF